MFGGAILWHQKWAETPQSLKIYPERLNQSILISHRSGYAHLNISVVRSVVSSYVHKLRPIWRLSEIPLYTISRGISKDNPFLRRFIQLCSCQSILSGSHSWLAGKGCSRKDFKPCFSIWRRKQSGRKTARDSSQEPNIIQFLRNWLVLGQPKMYNISMRYRTNSFQYCVLDF